MARRFAGKVALVTGGSRGIGAAIAKRLAQDGADIAISYVSTPEKAFALAKDIKHEGVQVAIFQADQADVRQVEELIKAVIEKFGRIDILVNNAGVYVEANVDDPSANLDLIARQFAINVTGVDATVRATVKFMKPGGRIITIGSVNGERVPFSGQAYYSATKSALIGFTKGWARDLGPKNITVNLIQPGPILTDMTQDDTNYSDALKRETALGRYGKPEEVAAVVAFIASPEASYVTGSILDVDGGYNA
jgi:3-oxoacyl-[acyl-carrier protein] reductase